jgi:leader peptidase (prepilin peptidase) / N-methyltransferase
LAITIFVFLFGIVIGSFLNVCILRIPEEVSIVAPASKCPKCGTPIKWYDNVPVFGWIWLGGKCRACGTKISVMYPLVELATGLLFVACYEEFGITQTTIKWLFFTCLLIVLTITDLRVRMLPDLVNWPGFAAGLFFSAIVPPSDGLIRVLLGSVLPADAPAWVLGLMNGLAGAAIGSLGFWGLGAVFSRLMGRSAFGLGDVKMLAMIGAFLGIRGVFFTLLLGSLIGSIVGIAVITGLFFAGWKKAVAERAERLGVGRQRALRWTLAKRYQLPFGTYLGMGAMAVVYLRPEALQVWIGSLLSGRL